MKERLVKYFIIGTFVTLYLLVSCISTIHVIDFFNLSNPTWLSISLAVAFEVGAAASLASLITLEKMNKAIVWTLFIILTAMQAMGNAYYAYIHLNNFQGWIELFGLVEEDLIYQKRVLSIVSGAILPVVALGFIKSLVDYIKPAETDIFENPLKPTQLDVVQELRQEPAAAQEKSIESIQEDNTTKQEVSETTPSGKTPQIDNFINIDNRIARGGRQ